jgi:hypothetical protein
MSLARASEEVLAPELMLPVQFQQLWHVSSATSPERSLALRVVLQAANDLRAFRYARGRRRQQLYMDAYSWLLSDDRRWPYSFLNLCGAMGLSAEAVRQELIEGTRPRPLSRPSRSARRRSSGLTTLVQPRGLRCLK